MQQAINNIRRSKVSLSIRVGQQCSARIFALLGLTVRQGGTKQPSGKSAQCPKAAHRIWRADANFLLATETIMCYNILVKTSTATATPEKPGSTTCRADITIPASAGSSMRMILPIWEIKERQLAITYLHIVRITLCCILIHLVIPLFWHASVLELFVVAVSVLMHLTSRPEK